MDQAEYNKYYTSLTERYDKARLALRGCTWPQATEPSLGDAPAFTQRLGVCVINADAPNIEVAIRYVEWLVSNTNA